MASSLVILQCLHFNIPSSLFSWNMLSAHFSILGNFYRTYYMFFALSNQNYKGKSKRIHYSGSIITQDGNMVDILREHDRSIQEAVRKARCPTRTESCKMDEWGRTVNAGPKTPDVRSSKSWNGSTAFFHKASLERGKLIRTTADVEKMMLGHMVDIFQQLKINTRILAKTSLPSEMIRAFVWNVYCWAWKNLWGGCLRNTSQGL
jgi:hypothetical protein